MRTPSRPAAPRPHRTAPGPDPAPPARAQPAEPATGWDAFPERSFRAMAPQVEAWAFQDGWSFRLLV